MAGHAVQPLGNLATSAIALTLAAAGHVKGWPVIAGGSVQLANALISHFQALGGTMQTNFHVENLKQIPSARAYLFDTDPAQMLRIAGDEFSASYRGQLQKFRHGMGVFKIDWALSGPVPFTNAQCRKAVTVHIGNTFEEIHTAEWQTSRGAHQEKPFIIFVQPGVVDPGRAPEGKHSAWAYCHVPARSTLDMTQQIENQIERFAPGFKLLILAKSTTNTLQLEQYNPNYVGGDISGGMMSLKQLFFRPAFKWPPYRTSSGKIFICSASTPPGGGVHGMCGYHAARTALRDVFGIKFSL
jgi:phytoene dehydrogenase-like protein